MNCCGCPVEQAKNPDLLLKMGNPFDLLEG